jgi:hypothetical protein
MWRRGKPTLFLDAGQRAWVRRFQEREGNAVWCIGRQRGKSYAALTLACETALQNPGAIIRYAAKTKDSARQIVTQTLEQVLQWCEEQNRPAVDEAKGVVRWPNGSLLTWAGTDAETFNRLRGPRAHLILLDEAAFYQDLEMVEAALLPQLTTTKGKALYLSTPPESLGHPFVARFRAAQSLGLAERETIEDNPRLTSLDRDRILKSFADMQGMSREEARASTFWRREYMAEFVTEESRAAIPAWTPEVAEACVIDYQRPEYRDHYDALDLGYNDGHGVLFMFWDFVAQKLVVEDEIYLRHKDTDTLATAIKQKERELYGELKYDGTLLGATDWDELPEYARNYIHARAPKQPYLRVSDNDLLVLSDISQRHGLTFLPTRKDDKANAVDDLNIAVRRGQIAIHPRCRQLQRQMFTTVWDKPRRGWERTADGHGELVDCLVYGWRNIRKHRDPRPIQHKTEWEKWVESQNKQSGNEWDKLRRIRRGA